MDIPEEWLEAFNRDAEKKNISHMQRPFMAISEWTRQNRCSIVYGSEECQKAFAWFEARSPKGAHAIGALYVGTFFYDAYFWKISVPVVYGRNQVNLLDFIPEMPGSTKERLKSQREVLTEFALVGVDCVDYAYGTDDIQHGGTTITLPLFAKQLASSADGYLRGTVDLLCSSRIPNPRAMETASLATEMFLKSYLVTHASLDEDGAKRLSHRLNDIIKECINHSNSREMKNIAELIEVFPDVNARYEGVQYDSPALWNAYAAAQQAGVAFVRSVTDRDMRPLILGKG
jgi:hypothetical protein